ncbi:MAG: hypothetical protein ACD_81C00215G0002 [uncultured bacterium]|uniref:Uncharacterized protein n=1 Tax=Candidatus Wolfebacteria bacterium GW2011_GWE2_44_13 TaxID=1619017 RepID=A0A0G1H9V5_9BACT|nr:MAG: hypothetical protein ACD_81C00215G0002 [uncultured bacterium]KKT43560.1 MAG: hypothetical protein UW32_C0001G0152 [Candidatus Wolfebacteria bacterium GW2011_GWE2_44_13]
MKKKGLLIALALVACFSWLAVVVTSAMIHDAEEKAFEAGRSASFGKLRIADANTVYELKLVGIAKDWQGVELAYDLEESFASSRSASSGAVNFNLPPEAKDGDKIFFDSFPSKKFVIVPR